MVIESLLCFGTTEKPRRRSLMFSPSLREPGGGGMKGVDEGPLFFPRAWSRKVLSM